jgi:flagellar biosynthesis/type III secretory pathway protein FliH
MSQRKPIKTKIPWKLHISIIKLQGELELTYEEACLRASELLDVNSKEFKEAVAAKARSLEKSSLMTKINKSRKTWTKKGYDAGYAEGQQRGYEKGVNEYKITYPCCICNKDLVMLPGNKDHEAAKQFLKKAGWGHSTCHEKK